MPELRAEYERWGRVRVLVHILAIVAVVSMGIAQTLLHLHVWTSIVLVLPLAGWAWGNGWAKMKQVDLARRDWRLRSPSTDLATGPVATVPVHCEHCGQVVAQELDQEPDAPLADRFDFDPIPQQCPGCGGRLGVGVAWILAPIIALAVLWVATGVLAGLSRVG